MKLELEPAAPGELEPAAEAAATRVGAAAAEAGAGAAEAGAEQLQLELDQ